MDREEIDELKEQIISKAKLALTAITKTSSPEGDRDAAATVLALITGLEKLENYGTETVMIQTGPLNGPRKGFVADEWYREEFKGEIDNDQR